LCALAFSAISFIASAVFFRRSLELDGGRQLVALQFVEPVVESARLEPRRIEMLPPFGARLAERVLEFDGLEPDARERFERSGNLGGELLSHAPELCSDRDGFPRGQDEGWHRRGDDGGGGGRA
jgi:hypothetical protein